MLDGKHRSSAAMLANKLIPCTVLEGSIEDHLKILAAHFNEKRFFWTVEERVRAMILNNDVPYDIKLHYKEHFDNIFDSFIHETKKIKNPMAILGLERKNRSFKKKNPKSTKRTGNKSPTIPK